MELHDLLNSNKYTFKTPRVIDDQTLELTYVNKEDMDFNEAVEAGVNQRKHQPFKYFKNTITFNYITTQILLKPF